MGNKYGTLPTHHIEGNPIHYTIQYYRITPIAAHSAGDHDYHRLSSARNKGGTQGSAKSYPSF